MSIDTRKTLLGAVGTAGASEWVYVGDADRVSVQVFGLAGGDIVRIEGSLEPEKAPANAVQIGDDITTDGIYGVNGLVGAIRVNYADDTGGGPVTAIIVKG